MSSDYAGVPDLLRGPQCGEPATWVEPPGNLLGTSWGLGTAIGGLGAAAGDLEAVTLLLYPSNTPPGPLMRPGEGGLSC